MNTTWNEWRNRAAAIALGGAVLAGGVTLALSHDATPVRLASAEKTVELQGPRTTSFAPVVKKVSPSVAKIYTAMKPKRMMTPEGSDSELPGFRWFFDQPRGGRGTPRDLNLPRQHGVGSGVIVSKDGYLLTNNHVVDDADEVKIGLQDGREFTAKVVGKDPKTDVAVLKIDAQDLPAIEIADSDQIEVGDVVLAVGNPFGIGQTVTMGMVSAKGRGNMGLDYEDFIQTDAAINPGNSGGALVDTEGRLVGINTAILSRSGGNQGIGFAVPANLARYVMNSLIKDGRVTRGYLGVIIQDVTPVLAKEFKLKDQSGVLVGDVSENSPAQKAGLRNGDVIVEFNGKTVSDGRQLKLEVAQTRPGTRVPVRILRDGSQKTLDVTLKELPGTDKLAQAASPGTADQGALNGVTVGDLDPQTRRQMDVPAHVKGAVVTEVASDSVAYEAGLQPGDVIQEINRQPIAGAADAVKLTEHPKDKTTLLRVWSKGNSHYVVVDESKTDKAANS